MDMIIHLLSAALLSLLISTILVITQCRHTFSQIRNAFVEHIQQRNATDTSAKQKRHPQEGTYTVAFFHPHCSSGGGGERVLWKIVEALGEMKEDALKDKKSTIADEAVRNNCRNLSVVIYTVDEPSATYGKDLMKHIQDRFSITISPKLEIHYLHLHNQKYLLQKSKRLTMIAESWGTTRLAWCALQLLTPHVFIDTTGCAFTFLVAKVLAGCKVGCYVHYPTISTDMLSLVWERRPSYNNSDQIRSNPIVTYLKLIYYSVFAILYGLVGSLSDLTMVNSSWTKNHIQYLWRLAGDIHVVFPPVDTKSLNKLSLLQRKNLILSIGQFRPEKDHILQLKAFALLLNKLHEKNHNVHLILIGSCRDDGDRERVQQLQNTTRELGIHDNVEFVLNQPYPVLRDYLSQASIGIHTMWNEHFGIGVVEMMAAGLITIAHNSGGPKSDIIERPWNLQNLPKGGKRPTGCLASTAEEYADAMYEIIQREQSEEVLAIRRSGRQSAERFSDQVFMKSIKETVMLSSILK